MSEEQIKTSEEKIEEVQNKIKDLLQINEIEELLKKNEVEVDIDGIIYKVNKPTFKQKREIYEKRIEKFTELIKDTKYMLEDDLKASYLKRGISIDELSNKIKNKMKQRDDLMMKLGEAIANKSPETEYIIFKKNIEELNEEIKSLSIRKSMLLEFSIENQVVIYMYSYLTFLVAEKKVEDKWIKVWNTYEEFENEKEAIVNKLSYYITMIAGQDELM